MARPAANLRIAIGTALAACSAVACAAAYPALVGHDPCQGGQPRWSRGVAVAALIMGLTAVAVVATPVSGARWARRARWIALALALAALSPFAASALHLTGARFWDYLRCPD